MLLGNITIELATLATLSPSLNSVKPLLVLHKILLCNSVAHSRHSAYHESQLFSLLGILFAFTLKKSVRFEAQQK